MKEFVTIIVPTFKRNDFFLRCIISLAKQDYKKEHYEVIAIHDGLDCDYNEQQIRNAVAQLKNFHFEKIAHGGVCRARNRGIHLAKGKFILLFDDDGEAREDWIKNFVTYIKRHPKVVGVGGTTLSIPPQTFLERYIDFKHLLRKPIQDEAGNIVSVITANACFRKKTLNIVGAFRKEFSYSGGEDLDISYRCRQIGKLAYSENAIVYHHHRKSFRELVKQHILYGRGAYLACKLNNLEIDFRVFKFYNPTPINLLKYLGYILKRIFTISLPEFKRKNLKFSLYPVYCYLDVIRKLSFITGVALEHYRIGTTRQNDTIKEINKVSL